MYFWDNIQGELGMNAGHSLQRKCGYRNVLKSDGKNLLVSREDCKCFFHLSYRKYKYKTSLLADKEPPNVYMLAMLIKKQHL